jgi:hypothetical protein
MSQQEDPEVVALRDYVITEAAHQQAKAAYEAARRTLLNLLPVECGEHSKKIGGFTLSVKYPEKVVWEATKLDALYGTDKPAHVKLSYSIDLRALRRLPKTEQDELAQCHTIKPGTPAIDIVKD